LGSPVAEDDLVSFFDVWMLVFLLSSVDVVSRTRFVSER